MRHVTTVAMLVLASLLAAGPALAQHVPLPTLFSERARFAERMVVVTGVVAFASAPGGGAQRFTIMDGGVTMDVVATGAFPVRPGNRVEVEGVYKLGPNSIEAFRVIVR